MADRTPTNLHTVQTGLAPVHPPPNESPGRTHRLPAIKFACDPWPVVNVSWTNYVRNHATSDKTARLELMAS